mmetsp:Transcript_375/g.600  ORF Transcript_375/g.600 Transcript_375/m.600 type:complete len:216 (-) Transcript_375:232-879(-)
MCGLMDSILHVLLLHFSVGSRAQAMRHRTCTPSSLSTISLMWPIGKANAAASTTGCACPRDIQPRSPAISPPFRQVLHSDTALHRCVKTLFSGLLSMASSASRRMHSASAKVRVTGFLLRTWSMGSLQSLCLTKICRHLTCFGAPCAADSSFGFLDGGGVGSSAPSFSLLMLSDDAPLRVHSKKTQRAVRLPLAPRAFAAASNAPHAIRGLALRL